MWRKGGKENTCTRAQIQLSWPVEALPTSPVFVRRKFVLGPDIGVVLSLVDWDRGRSNSTPLGLSSLALEALDGE